MKKILALALCCIAVTASLHAKTDYKIINATGKPLKNVTLSSLGDITLASTGKKIESFDLKAGEIKTVQTKLANCINTVHVDGEDGKQEYAGGGVCAGSVVCLTDHLGMGNHKKVSALAKPYYGDKKNKLPCSKHVAQDIAEGTAVVAGASLAGAAMSGVPEAGLIAVVPLIGGAGALAGCGLADLAAESGYCIGSGGVFSADVWQKSDGVYTS